MNIKSYVLCRMVPLSMTLSHPEPQFQGHSIVVVVVVVMLASYLGTCESAVCIRIKYRIESGVKIRIRIQIESSNRIFLTPTSIKY